MFITSHFLVEENRGSYTAYKQFGTLSEALQYKKQCTNESLLYEIHTDTTKTLIDAGEV